jgi:hypothetical protein
VKVSDHQSAKTRTGRPGARWAFLEGFDVGAGGDPYLDRLRIIQTPWFGVYLHHIHRPDIDRDPHDHPWAFASLVIAGGYTERVWPDKRDLAKCHLRQRDRWSLRLLRRSGAHIITEIQQSLWTLVVVGPRRADWGFWTPGGFVGWKEYTEKPSVL